jgi:hypothetical protein
MGRGARRRPPVADVPEELRADVSRAIEALIDGPDEQVEPSLNELWQLLDPHPELRRRFERLRIVDDATEFLK